MELSNADWLALSLSLGALAVGGILKGATGAGVPILAVPVIALFYDVRTAVVVMILPSLLANVRQLWQYRAHLKESVFAGRLAGMSIFGAALGTVLLANLAPRLLLVSVALLVLIYVAFRLARPGWKLASPIATRLAPPVGFAAGVLQGATGISAPISLTFLNACRLPRPVFVATVSAFFVVSTSVQMLGLAAYGFLTWQGLALSAAALVLILLTMPLGEALARRLTPALFDKLILALLVAVALRVLLGG